MKHYCGKNVSIKRLRKLFEGKAPSVIVLVDSHKADWVKDLNDLGVSVCVFEVYKNVRGRFVYRTSGQYPPVVSQEAHCRPHHSLPNVVEVVGEIEFTKLSRDSKLEVSFDQLLTRWEPFEDSGRKYLRLDGALNPLSPTGTYGLIRDKSDRYFFQRS